MSQNDLSIANQGFASFRSDLNSALQALGSTNSGTSAPSTTYANQLFYDTTNNILKIRNEDNDAFISLFTLDQTNDNIESLTINGALTADSLSIDNITIDSTEIDLSSGSFTIDSASDITLDADGGAVMLKDGGTEFGRIFNSASDLIIKSAIQDKDIKFQGVDGTDTVNALVLNMSDGGTAQFNSGVQTTQINTGSSTSTLTIFGGGTNKGGTIEMSGGNNTGSTGAGIVFKTGASTSSPSERMRILSGGSVLINRSSSNTVTSTALDIDADEYVFGIVITANGTNGAFVRLLADDGTTVGSIDHSGSNARYLTSSDYRLKENIVDMTDATTRIKQLKPRRFNFIADETNTTVDGFIAHEVSGIVPEAVNGEKDAVDADGNIDPQGIDQSKLVPLLTKALQELEARITALEGS